jgi:heterodisulfide reductase subunit A2
MDIVVLYRDMRSYGLREDLYRKAREKGVQFLKYDEAAGLDVSKPEATWIGVFKDTALRRQMVVRPDLMVLATAIVPPRDNPLARMFKVTLNEDGFFMEAHVKLRPSGLRHGRGFYLRPGPRPKAPGRIDYPGPGSGHTRGDPAGQTDDPRGGHGR